jgi:peptidoglycan/xylan/chitin deacetylase (PgdA/CDA1 family)
VKLPIIVYHSIDNYGTSLSTRVETFTKQIRYFSRHGFQSIAFEEVISAISERKSVPPKSVILTFDDGMPSLLEHAEPILTEHGMSGTVFVVTGQVGQKPSWFRLHERYRERPLLNRDGLERLVSKGWEMQPHTHDHPVLTHISRNAQAEQISVSRDCVRRWFGTAGRVLAYPFGQFNADSAEAMESSDMAMGLTLRFSVFGDPAKPYAWPRIGSAWFKQSDLRQRLALGGLLEWYVRARNIVKGDRSRHFQVPTDEMRRGLPANVPEFRSRAKDR